MQLLFGDCLEIFPSVIQSASIDAVICDLPYGTTQNKWDSIIPLESLWKEYRRVCKGAVILNAGEPFTSVLINSNLSQFKYRWTWNKVNGIRNHLNAKHQPMRCIEDIAVFYERSVYHPQMRKGSYQTRKTTPGQSEGFGKVTRTDIGREVKELYPVDLIEIPSHDPNHSFHPTQKPVALMEYLIRTYTNEGDVVLDNCMGSGTTGVACMNTNREFIGIEKDLNYFRIARERILEAQFQQTIRNAERLVSHA